MPEITPDTDNPRLEELFKGDQKDREGVYTSQDEIDKLHARDLERRREVREMMNAGLVNTNSDLYRASLIFQHGEEPKDFLTAHRLSTIAAINGHKPSRWLLAAALDRFLMTAGLPQVYSTQFEHDPAENKYKLRLPVDDSTVLPLEKKYLNVPLVKERLAQLNNRIQAKK